MIPIQQAMAFVENAVDGMNRETLEAAAASLAAEVRRLREENERLRKDAERYRWLRELAKSNSGITRAQAFFWNCAGSRRQLDMAIDAARGAK